MSEMTFEEAKAAIAKNRELAPEMSIWTHRKTGHEYVVDRHVIIETTISPAVVYYGLHDAETVCWCRPASEFFDGRFEQ